MASTYTGVIFDLLNPTKDWIDSDPKKDLTLIPKIFDLWYQFKDTVYSLEIVVSGGSSFLSDLSFSLLNGQVLEVADYMAEIQEEGAVWTGAKCDLYYNNTLKELRIRIKNGQTIGVNDSISLKWFWDIGLARYRDVGFYQLEYDYAVYYKTGNWYRGTLIDGDSKESTNSKNTTVPTSITGKCGEDASYLATNVKDENRTTEWHHSGGSPHNIVLDMGGSKKIGAVDIYYTGIKGNIWTVNIYVSANTTFTTPIVSGASVSGSAGWRHMPFAIQDGMRYVKVEISSTDNAIPIPDTALYDFGEVQVSTFLHNTLPWKGLRWEIKWYNLTSYTSDGFEFLDIRNTKVTRYKELGEADGAIVTYLDNIDKYDSIWINATIPFYPSNSVDFPNGIDVGVQLAVSDDGSTWSSYFGSDGTSSTYFKWSDRMIDSPLPGGKTGYYFKWKFFLFSDGRDTPILNSFWVLVWLLNYQKELTTKATTYPSYGSASPVISVPLDFKRLEPYSKYLTYLGTQLDPVDLFLIHSLGGFHMDILSGWQRWAKYWLTVSSWLESVVGQVVHGYVRDQNENIILNAFKVIITSTYAFGFDSMGTVDPTTGFFELFVKSTKYDNRWLIAQLNTGKTFDIAYRKYGLPGLLDGTTMLASPQDLHFWVPSQICGKSVAYVGSLVTY